MFLNALHQQNFQKKPAFDGIVSGLQSSKAH